jgi:hypothetical protein
MPMIPELAIAFLAIIKIGGIILPLFSGYGHGALVARLTDAGATAVVTADGLFRRGAVAPMKPTVDAACEDVASIAHVIVVNRTGLTDTPWTPGRDRWWHDLISRQPAEATTEITDAEDVLMLIYTSGTTGKPKGAVHTHCGFPIKAAQDMRHSMDLKPERHDLLVHRHGLDDGAVARFWRAAQRRHDGFLRRRTRFSGGRPRLGAGCTPRHHPSGHFADADPQPQATRRRAGAAPQSHLAARRRLYRQPVGPGKLAVDLPHVLRARSRSSTTLAAPRSAAASSAATSSDRSSQARSAGRWWAWTPTWSTTPATPCAARSANWSSASHGSA